jgi:polysaccharide biosynthesis transport protein
MTLLRKYGRWLILATLAGIIGAWLVQAILPVRYVSTAQVDVEPNLAVVGTSGVTPNMVTEQEVATSGVVLASAAPTLGIIPAVLQKDVTAAVAGTSATGGTANVLSISCAMPTATAAQQCATAVTVAYIGYRNDASQSNGTQAHNPINVTLVTAATMPDGPAGPGKKILLPIGAVIGLLLGIAAIFARDYFDHRVRDRADLERCLDAPVLAVIPAVRRPHDVFLRKPFSPAAEAYRYLREHLSSLIAPGSDGGVVLLVAGAHHGEGYTSVAANLAAALAEVDASVLLVDADLQHPSLNEVFQVGPRSGWYDMVAGRAALDEVAVPVEDVPRLRLVTAGVVAFRPAGIFTDARLAQAFRTMRAQADFVVVDSAPVLEVSYAITLARMSDVVAVVADARRTTREAVRAVVRQIKATGPRTIVGVLRSAPSPEGQPPPDAVPEPESLAPPSKVPAALAAMVPPRGHNGGHRTKLGIRSGRQQAPDTEPDMETDVGDNPGSQDTEWW